MSDQEPTRELARKRDESTTPTARTCILCRSPEVVVLTEIAFESIWRALEHDFETTFARRLRDSLSPAETTSLYQCGNCTLEFFEPAVPATPDYYEALSRTGRYYEADRWEFGVLADMLEKGNVVVDFASGMGGFSERAKEVGCTVIAVDTNPDAISSRHPEVRVETEIPKEMRGQADVFCAFQVLEHVDDPVALAGLARSVVRPGGRVALSVPNNQRIARLPLEPLDHPPHHLTRWTPEALRALAGEAGLVVETVRCEQPLLWDVRWAIYRRAASLCQRVPVSGSVVHRATAILYPKWLDRRLRQRELLTRLGLHGHTMLAVLRRPAF